MRNDFRYVFIALKRVYRSVLGIQEGADIDATIEGIKKDITFKGHKAWILIFSIFIASIGLNVNSTAVIIGAMLISPLMGPILGIGLSIGTNDFETLIRSLKNLGIAIAISLFTSTLYFAITPLNIEQSELLSRTKPTLLDVLVALFGGFAGIMAGSRKEKSNVIPGVAIATALMPPLCTAGYGLATMKLNYFIGAFYLFFINSVFISLSTFIVVKYLKFPLIEYVSAVKWRRYKFILYFILIITITPSTIIFYDVIQETRFTVGAEDFIKNNCKFNGSELINYKLQYTDTLSVVDFYFIGKTIPEYEVSEFEKDFNQYIVPRKSWLPVTGNIIVRFHQESDKDIDIEQTLSELNNNLRIKILEDIYTKNEEIVKNKDRRIQLLEDEIMRLSEKDSIPLTQLRKELHFHFPSYKKFSYANSIQVNTEGDSITYDTIPLFLLKLSKALNNKNRKKQLDEVEKWLQIRLENSNIEVLEY